MNVTLNLSILILGTDAGLRMQESSWDTSGPGAEGSAVNGDYGGAAPIAGGGLAPGGMDGGAEVQQKPSMMDKSQLI